MNRELEKLVEKLEGKNREEALSLIQMERDIYDRELEKQKIIDMINEAIYSESYLFLFRLAGDRLDDIIEGLNEESIEIWLRSRFREESYELSHKASVTLIERSKRWRISDGDDVYVVERDKEKLNISKVCPTF